MILQENKHDDCPPSYNLATGGYIDSIMSGCFSKSGFCAKVCFHAKPVSATGRPLSDALKNLSVRCLLQRCRRISQLDGGQAIRIIVTGPVITNTGLHDQHEPA